MDSIISTVGNLLKLPEDVNRLWKLPEEVQRLRNSLPWARTLVDRADWGRFKNKELAEQLLLLKDAVYDAEDVIDEFDTEELKTKVEGGVPSSFRAKVEGGVLSLGAFFKDFVKDRAGHIVDLQGNLDQSSKNMERMLRSFGLDVDPRELGKPLMPETGSMINEPRIVGRDQELRQVLTSLGVPVSAKRPRRLGRTNVSVNVQKVSILPIVGIGGVGKTTLAQLVYNDTRVQGHFDLRVWVCVSDYFDIKRVTQEILESIVERKDSVPISLNDLQVSLKMQLESKRFLLVLDDVWTDEQWQRLCAPLMLGLQGSSIMVTTRFSRVATMVGSMEPIHLKGLPDNVFLEFFKACAFDGYCAQDYPNLETIGQTIALRLYGSPLAAKTLGRLLNLKLDEVHWMTISKSELWELDQKAHEILPALQLSYQYLPAHLKRCFAFCSMYPQDYSFGREELVDVWVSEGLVASQTNILAESIGSSYLDDLISRFFFQTDPERSDRYVMHDLMHDLARSVSKGECYLIRKETHQQNLACTMRHISIEVEDHEVTSLKGTHSMKKWRSIRFQHCTAPKINWWLNELKNIRLLILRRSGIEELPESIGYLKHLRHLDLTWTPVSKLPISLWSLYNLQVLKAEQTKVRRLHQDITKLISLRRLQFPNLKRAIGAISNIGRLTSLQDLPEYKVLTNKGHGIRELKHMNQICGSLYITHIGNVQSKEDAAQASLVTKHHLQRLELNWRPNKNQLVKSINLDSDVLESLQPSPNLKTLSIKGYMGDKSPSWLQPLKLPHVEDLTFDRIYNLKVICISLPSLKTLKLFDTEIESISSGKEDCSREHGHNDVCSNNTTESIPVRELYIVRCGQMKSLENWLLPHFLPSITSIRLLLCPSLKVLPVDKFVGFVSLEELEIKHCRLQCPKEMILPASIRYLSLEDCGQLDLSIPNCLNNLSSLTLLRLVHCSNVASIPLASSNLESLKCVVLKECQGLSTIEGEVALGSINYVEISNCHNLAEVQQPYCEYKQFRGQEVRQPYNIHFVYREEEEIRIRLFNYGFKWPKQGFL